MLPIALSILGFVILVGIVIGVLSGALTALCGMWSALAAAHPRAEQAPEAARGSCILVLAQPDVQRARGRRHNVNYAIDAAHLHLSLDSGVLSPSRPLSIAWSRCGLVPVPPQKRNHMGEYTALALPPFVIALPLTVIERAWELGIEIAPADDSSLRGLGLNTPTTQRAADDPRSIDDDGQDDAPSPASSRDRDDPPEMDDPYATPRRAGQRSSSRARDPWEVLDIPPARAGDRR